MVHGGEHLRAVADIGNESRCLAADLGYLTGDALDAVGPGVHQCHRRTVAGQAQRDATADTACRTGHQRNPALESHDYFPSLGSTRTFIFVPACSASNPSSITSSSEMRVTHPVVS